MRYVFDVDGTLSFDGTQISNQIVREIQALARAGNEVSFASARPIRDLVPIIPDFAQNHLLIGGNGAIVQTPDNQLVVTQPMNEASYALIKQLIGEYHLDYVVDGKWDYAAKVAVNHQITRQLDPANLAKRIALSEIQEPIKIILLNVPNAHFADILARLSANVDLAVVAHTGENSLDITAAGVNKYTTLRRYTQDAYYAFGNDSNDFELLQYAEKSVWIGGENERLRRLNLVPDLIVEGTDEDVANAFKLL